VSVLLVSLLLQAQAPSLAGIERDLARAEKSELREPGSERFFFLDQDRLGQFRGQIEAYLRAKPDDPTALVLLGRVGRFVLRQSRSAACSPEHGCLLDSTFDDGPFQAALDRALILRADDPEAHFWKARLLDDGRPVLRNGEFAVDVDTEQVVAHAQRASTLDPTKRRYREFLAVTLSDLGRYADARAVIRNVDGGKHLLNLVFQDLDAVPVPEGAVPWPDGSAPLAAVGMDEWPPQFARQAGRSYASLMSLDEVEAFYRRRWPKFRFFRSESDSGRIGGITYLRPDRSGKLQPAPDSSFMAMLDSARSYDGILIGAGPSGPRFESRNEHYPPAMAGKPEFLEIIIVTGRRGPRH
jgi:hypothetical protein